MVRCGCTGTCACRIDSGRLIDVDGNGSSQDPFVIRSTASIHGVEGATFLVSVLGEGTLESPWQAAVSYSESAELTHLPDVDAPTPANGDALVWSEPLGKWISAPRTSAAPGAVNVGEGLEGDGSAGAPLAVVAAPDRFLQVTASGVGMTDAAVNRLVRVHATATARALDPIPPVPGALSLLLDSPRMLSYWDGGAWEPVPGAVSVDAVGQVLALSGSYAGGPVTSYLRVRTATTDTTGAFEVIPAADLTGYAGVVGVTVQPLGTSTVAWTCEVRGAVDRIVGQASRLDTGNAYVGAPLSMSVTATLY